jgi:hypothetical protein
MTHPRLSPEEFERRKQRILETEAKQPYAWWWLSFVDGTKPKDARFRGVIIVRAQGVLSAILRTHELAINPGGEAIACVFNNLLHDDAIAPYADRLLQKGDWPAAWDDSVEM